MISTEQNKNILPFLLKYLIIDFNEVPINTIIPVRCVFLYLILKKKALSEVEET